MPCYQSQDYPGGVPPGTVSHITIENCLEFCKEGACCESNGTCNVRPQCQCQSAGQAFQGVGTVCSPNPCDPCGIKCGGAGAPRELAVTITGVTFRNDSAYDADDLPFPIPSTFVLPLVGVGCSEWQASFYPRAVGCAPCGGTTTLNELLVVVGESGGSLIVQVALASGAVGEFNVCLGPATLFFESKENLAASPLTPICGIPFSSTITTSNALCPLQSVSYTIEPA